VLNEHGRDASKPAGNWFQFVPTQLTVRPLLFIAHRESNENWASTMKAELFFPSCHDMQYDTFTAESGWCAGRTEKYSPPENRWRNCRTSLRPVWISVRGHVRSKAKNVLSLSVASGALQCARTVMFDLRVLLIIWLVVTSLSQSFRNTKFLKFTGCLCIYSTCDTCVQASVYT
jgi:hypothetical protein